MGDYIKSHAEVRDPDTGEWSSQVEDVLSQSYDMYALVFGYQPRNYAAVPTSIIPEPNGLPEDVSDWVRMDGYSYVHCGCCGFAGCDNEEHSYEPKGWAYSHIPLTALLEFDYDTRFEYRRNCGDTVPAGQGEVMSYREMLGEHYFEQLEKMRQLSPNPEDVRLVLWLT